MIYILFIGCILFMIILAGFMAGSETAITGASKAYLYHLSKKGNKKAKAVIALQEKMTSTIGTLLVANQMIVYCIPIIITFFASKHLTSAETAILQTITAIMLVTYSEIVPKMLAIQFASRYALFVAYFIQGVVCLLKPIISILEYIAKISLKLIGININSDSFIDKSSEELRGAIEMHSSGSAEEDAQKKSMLKSILDLEEIFVSHVMVHRKNLKTMNASLPIKEIAEELMKCPFTRVPIWKDNPENIIGILKTKTFFREMQRNNGEIENIQLSKLLVLPWFIPETTHLLDQLKNFQTKREHFALVVDEYGDLMGCITLEDILEEIVGDIDDEYDSIEDDIKVQNDGSIIINGSTPIRDINRHMEWEIPDSENATIAGYIMHELRKIPDVGQTYILSQYKIEILRRQRNQITLVKIKSTES